MGDSPLPRRGERAAPAPISRRTTGGEVTNPELQRQRTLQLAAAFLHEVRRDVEHAAASSSTLAPRLRSVHERAGHTTPEYRTMAIPVPEAVVGRSPELLSQAIARFAEEKRPVCLLLALDLLMDTAAGPPQSALIFEARDAADTRRYLVQTYEVDRGKVKWDMPRSAAWLDPGDQEMILDAAFVGGSGTR